MSYLLSDHLGSTSLTVDSAGNVTSEMRYSPWGDTRFTSGTSPTNYRFTGQRQESSFGLYFYNARWYDSSLGRFAQADTIIPGGVQGYDRYAAMNNNPIKYTDPTGHTAWQGDGGEGKIHCDLDCLRARRADKQEMSCTYHLCSDTNLYALGWQNFGQAWSIYFNPNATLWQRWLAGTYMSAWGGYHVIGAAGTIVLAAEAIVPGSMACVANPACEERATTEVEHGITVLGRWSANRDVANDIGGKYLNIPMETWDSLDEVGRWALNQQWLDDAIARGDTFILASKFADAGTSYFFQELQYLFEKGYTMATSQYYLIPPP